MLGCITSGSGDASEEAIEQTEFIFIIGIGSCSSLHRAFALSAKSKQGLTFFIGLWRMGPENKKKGSDNKGFVDVHCLNTFFSALILTEFLRWTSKISSSIGVTWKQLPFLM